MKLKEYIDNLNKFVKENPEALELDVISIDPHTNWSSSVYHEPCLGHYDPGDFFDEEAIEMKRVSPCIYDNKASFKINAVCIN